MASSSMVGLVPSLLLFCLVLVADLGQLSARPIGEAVSTNGLPGDECKKITDANYCLEIVNVIPGAANATELYALTDAIIPYAHNNSAMIYQYTEGLDNRNKDPGLASKYSDCIFFFHDATENLDEAGLYLSKNAYDDVNFMATLSLGDAKNCSKALSSGPPSAAPVPPELTQKINYFTALVEYLVIVSNDLYNSQ